MASLIPRWLPPPRPTAARPGSTDRRMHSSVARQDGFACSALPSSWSRRAPHPSAARCGPRGRGKARGRRARVPSRAGVGPEHLSRSIVNVRRRIARPQANICKYTRCTTHRMRRPHARRRGRRGGGTHLDPAPHDRPEHRREKASLELGVPSSAALHLGLHVRPPVRRRHLSRCSCLRSKGARRMRG